MEENKQKFEDLLTSGIPLIAVTAQQARDYAMELKDGKITQAEYEDLLEDLTCLENIDSKLFQVEIYREVCKAFQYLATLKAIASFL